jgi:hypothetical protein
MYLKQINKLFFITKLQAVFGREEKEGKRI